MPPLSSNSQKRLFILGSVVVLILAIVLYWRLQLLVESFKLIEHTNSVETTLQRSLTFLRDAETAEHSYILTRDPNLLQPYVEGQDKIDESLEELEALTRDNLKQLQNLANLRYLMHSQFVLFKKTLDSSPDSTLALRDLVIRGQKWMDRTREQINSMSQEERNVMQRHQAVLERYRRLTPISLLVLVLAMLCIIGFSYYGLTKQLRRTQETAAQLDDANREYLLKNKQLENSVEELNSFNYIASHDLKEPLRKIVFFTDLLLTHEPTLSSEGRKNLEKMQNAASRMKNLLTDLLTYAQASMGEQQKERVDLNQLLDTVVESFAEAVREKEAVISYANLPQVLAVSSQMQQLFENLISNSLKYSRPDTPPVITIKSREVWKWELPPSFKTVQERYVEMLFSDNGIGFDQENADRVFVLFQRLHQRHEFSGTGIGLTICKKIIQNHDGFILAQSNVDRGTTFIIYLPA